MAFFIRPYETRDLGAIYDICLKTGDSGEDATALYSGPGSDPEALGHLYAGPYVTLEPHLAFILTDEVGVAGYILGALDTQKFNERYGLEWLPPLQAKLPDPTGEQDSWSATEHLYHRLHHPDLAKPVDLDLYPSHLHIDLLPRAQGQGWGRELMMTLFDALKKRGSVGVHLGLDARNEGAFEFYKRLNFDTLVEGEGAIYMGQRFGSSTS